MYLLCQYIIGLCEPAISVSHPSRPAQGHQATCSGREAGQGRAKTWVRYALPTSILRRRAWMTII